MGERRKRRTFSEAFKAEAVRLVRDEGKTVAAAARALDLAESGLRLWVRDAEREARRTGALSNGERKELEQLRRENRTLRMERDILKNFRARLAVPPVARETRGAAMLKGAPGAVAVRFMVPSRAR
jgi:transposase